MDEEFVVFVVLLTLISGGLFLIFTKMMLNFFRERRQNKGASMGTSELEALIERAVEAGTASLHDRLDDLEQQIGRDQDRRRAQPKALPAAQSDTVLEDLLESDESVEVPQSRRSGR